MFRCMNCGVALIMASSRPHLPRPPTLHRPRRLRWSLSSMCHISVALAPGFVLEAATSRGVFPALSVGLQLANHLAMREAICIHIGQELWYTVE